MFMLTNGLLLDMYSESRDFIEEVKSTKYNIGLMNNKTDVISCGNGKYEYVFYYVISGRWTI